ncbi:MAG: hypothetical protein LBS75_06950 [Synergistaceae bacterium]|jgi:hypothetical protein|nr:hypothetical protein [Synergistaceae bacterium]
MEENGLSVSSKELFYSAMMLGLDKLVNVEYVFPADETRMADELEEVKRGLRKKRMLKENTKGEITLDFGLSLCAAFCSKPDSCGVVDEDGLYGTIYKAAETYMFLERTGEGENAAKWFKDSESLDEHITRRLGAGAEAGADGGE